MTRLTRAPEAPSSDRPAVLSEANQHQDAKIRIVGVSHSFAAEGRGEVRTLAGIDLEVRSGEFIALVGPSGCGKTTILNMLAGLVVPSEGQVLVDGRPARKPAVGDVGYMLARDALLPWRTALGNVEYPLELRGVGRKRRREMAMALLEEVGLGTFARYYPSSLSQGMRQRVAVARTFASDPQVLLMDEPFSALDSMTRLKVQNMFTRVWEEHKKTVLFVTHDVGEAVALADRVIVLSRGPGTITRILDVELPRPRDLRTMPENPWYQQAVAQIWRDLDLEAHEPGGVS